MSTPRSYKPGPIEPVVRVGENILTVDREAYSLYAVGFIEPLILSGSLVVNGGAIGASATLPLLSTQNQLDNNYGQLSQLRMRVIDDIDVTVFLPQSVARHGNLNVIASVNAFTALNFPDDEPSEFFIFENQRIFLSIRNPRSVAVAQSRVLFYGLKYILVGPGGPSTGGHVQAFQTFRSITEATSSGEKFTVLPTGGWGR